MGNNGFFHRWGKKEFLPGTLPPDYRSLMLLSLAALDYFIVSHFSSEKTLSDAIRKGRAALFNQADAFIGITGDGALDSDYFYGFLEKAPIYDIFEITLNLAAIFREASGSPSAFPLADLLDWPESTWNDTLEAAVFCRETETLTPPRRVAAQVSFISRHSRKILRNRTRSVYERIDWPQYLYFYFYCTASAKGLFKTPQQQIDAREVSRFAYQLTAQMTDKNVAILAAIRIWQTFSKLEAVKSAKIGEIYKLALFDRSRKAFTLMGEPGLEAIMVRPDSVEQSVIFDRNSF